MYSIEKDFGDFPCAHRQPRHSGHCQLVHGHNFSFKLRLGANTLDEQGFVFDFGQFSSVKEWLIEHFDHTLLLQHDDPQKEHLQRTLGDTGLAKIVWCDSVSAEGLAKMFFDYLVLWMAPNRGIQVLSVTVNEDWKNSATYEPARL